MAIFHLSAKIISRGKGKSAVAAAAYRSGEKIRNDYEDITHDYTRKGGIVHTEILLPQNAPSEYTDRSTLWNAVEQIEKSKNSQLAREIEIALPIELTREQYISLVRQYVQKNFVDEGMCADICVHDKNDGNPHAHIMLTMRPFKENGTWRAKSEKVYVLDGKGEKIMMKSGNYKSNKLDTTDWNRQYKVEEWRESWANFVNATLLLNEIDERVDHRSFERQGIEQIPTVHMGVAAMQMEQRGISTEIGDRYRKIEADNKALYELKLEINKLKNWIDNEINHSKNSAIETPNLIDTLTAIYETGGQGYDQRYIQTIPKTLAFLRKYDIATLPELQEKVKVMRADFNKLSNELKSIEKKIDKYKKHLAQADIYFGNKDLHLQYKKLPQKKQQEFYNKNQTSIYMFEKSRDYFKKIIGDNNVILTKTWTEEIKKLTTKKDNLYKDYKVLKDGSMEIRLVQREVALVLQPAHLNQKRRNLDLQL